MWLPWYPVPVLQTDPRSHFFRRVTHRRVIINYSLPWYLQGVGSNSPTDTRDLGVNFGIHGFQFWGFNKLQIKIEAEPTGTKSGLCSLPNSHTDILPQQQKIPFPHHTPYLYKGCPWETKTLGFTEVTFLPSAFTRELGFSMCSWGTEDSQLAQGLTSIYTWHKKKTRKTAPCKINSKISH